MTAENNYNLRQLMHQFNHIDGKFSSIMIYIVVVLNLVYND